MLYVLLYHFRYLRIVEELQRVEIWDMSREEKLAFFINLYNMMAIHAISILGHPDGTLERRKLFGEFKYVIGGSTYSLSAIQNGILRGNLRPPYNLKKPFGAKDKRSKVSYQY
jgi:histidinol phosphatase-like PHP family hydrolase